LNKFFTLNKRMFNICKIIFEIFNYCFPIKNQENKYKKYDLYFSKYRYQKFTPKLEIIYEK